jgi:hypothetical protein
VTFDQLDPKKQDVLADAYLSDLIHRNRTLVALPLGGVVLGVLGWFFLHGDDSGYGWVMMLITGGPVLGILGSTPSERAAAEAAAHRAGLMLSECVRDVIATTSQRASQS